MILYYWDPVNLNVTLEHPQGLLIHPVFTSWGCELISCFIFYTDSGIVFLTIIFHNYKHKVL